MTDILIQIAVLQDLTRIILNIFMLDEYFSLVLTEHVAWFETPWFIVSFFERYRYENKILYGWQVIFWKINWQAHSLEDLRIKDFALHHICDLNACI